MIKKINHDLFFLGLKAKDADKGDFQTALDLIDTLNANKENCVGIAANMIGVCKKIIVVKDGDKNLVMFNPVIIDRYNEYESTEACLSLTGSRTVKRYNRIKVEFQNFHFNKQIKNYSGYLAKIIQHEIDHCNGIII